MANKYLKVYDSLVQIDNRDIGTLGSEMKIQQLIVNTATVPTAKYFEKFGFGKDYLHFQYWKQLQ